MESPTLSYLAMQSGCLIIVPLNAIHAEVMNLCLWVFGVHQGQGDEVSSIFWPQLKKREARELRWLVDRARGIKSLSFKSDLREIKEGASMVPQTSGGWWHQRMGERRNLLHQLLWVSAEGEVNPSSGAEEIGH
jgi:hypothetical protein